MSEPSRDWKEIIGPDEAQAFAALSAELAGIAKDRDAGKTQERALHPKGHLGLAATLTVRGDLPEPARQGVFAKAGEHRAYVRLSNGTARPGPDRAPDLRGFALKILGVDGKKALGDARTQDFLMVDAYELPFRSTDEFMALIRAGKDPKRLLGSLISQLGFFRALGLVGRIVSSVKGKRTSLFDLEYTTVAPVAFGPYAGRVRVVPKHAKDTTARAGSDADYLRAEAVSRANHGGLSFDVGAQFFTSEAETPIERIDQNWSSPWTSVATLAIEPRKEGERLDRFVESLSFDPWHALDAHRPLGQTMRARKATYFASVQQRAARGEPDGSEWPTGT